MPTFSPRYWPSRTRSTFDRVRACVRVFRTVSRSGSQPSTIRNSPSPVNRRTARRGGMGPSERLSLPALSRPDGPRRLSRSLRRDTGVSLLSGFENSPSRQTRRESMKRRSNPTAAGEGQNEVGEGDSVQHAGSYLARPLLGQGDRRARGFAEHRSLPERNPGVGPWEAKISC